MPRIESVHLIRPPRLLWPFNSASSAFWPPLAFLSLAAAVRSHLPDLEVRILDCPGRKIGWKSLQGYLEEHGPDVVGIGEEAVSSSEGMRLAALAKSIKPATVTVGGGHFYPYMEKESLNGRGLDFIVRDEGEETLVGLLDALMTDRDPATVPGILFKRDNRIVRTPRRPLIGDLDDLPRPAWDLLPLERYGEGSRNHPGLVSVEHGRGCRHACAFCILWSHMGQRMNGKVLPHYRTKSPERSFSEVEELYHTYDRRTFGWVDPTWNMDPDWTGRFSEKILGSGMRIQSTAWMRADCVVRDEELGILEKQVRAGLVQAMIGVERVRKTDLRAMTKEETTSETARKAFHILSTRYPEVFTIGTFIYGTENETEETLRELGRFEYTSGMDYAFFIPETPNPGSKEWHEKLRSGRLEEQDFSRYNFHTPVCGTRKLHRASLERICLRHFFSAPREKLRRAARIRREGSPRRRRVYRSLNRHGAKIFLAAAANALRRPFSLEPALYSRRPSWYES